MMNKQEAIAYGQKIGCKYYIYNNYGGLMGGFVSKKDATACVERLKAENENNPWDNHMKFFVKEV